MKLKQGKLSTENRRRHNNETNHNFIGTNPTKKQCHAIVINSI